MANNTREDTRKTLADMAFEQWQELAYRNCSTDIMVNDLLERIAGEKYSDYADLDDPIVTILNRLNIEELCDFISGCRTIDRADRGQS